MSESSREQSFLSSVIEAITRWLARARRAVFSAGLLYPDPSAVNGVRGDWANEVDRLLPELEATAAEAWETSSGRTYVSNNSFVLAQLAMTRNLLVRIPDEVYQRIFGEIADGQTNGESQQQIADRVDRVLLFSSSEWWPNRARVIAQTETHRAWQAGILASAMYYEPQTGPGWVKEWHTEMDGRERPSHRRADGQVRSLNEPFNVGGSLMRYPGDPTAPADEVINCVVGSTQIMAPQVRAAYRYWHEGTLLHVYTANGRVLSVSPNHPVLSVHGWTLAGHLVKGDNLISCLFVDDLAGSKPDVQTQPVVAQDIFDSLYLAWGSKRVRGLDVDFHGYRPNGDVEVVLPDRELDFGVKSARSEHVSKVLLGFADAPNPGGSPSLKPAISLGDTQNGLVGFGDLIGTLGIGHATPLEGFSLAASAYRKSGFPQSPVDDSSADTQLRADEVNRLSTSVSVDNVVDVQIDSSHSGYLYNFETASGSYVSNAIVSHNCRCDMIIRER